MMLLGDDLHESWKREISISVGQWNESDMVKVSGHKVDEKGC